ncbi:MAG TPA: peptide chain release factor N(5)-glutamine methyltransferase [Gaiellaceae bacterium]|nr:peptide chain release factor N(5)-glutamine methyltransferase [Gaiellaceae bacterium]
MRPPQAVADVERLLAGAGVPDPRVDAEILVAEAHGVPRSALFVPDGELSAAALARLEERVARRRRREPLQYVLGEWGFRRLTLTVDRRALIPRPETEVLVERSLALVAEIAEPRILDVGVGSGAIALALADERPDARVTAVDASADALSLARENAERTGLAGRVELVHGDLFAGVAGPFDLVVSNPPYVAESEIATLEPEVRDWEPREALVGEGVTEAVAAGARSVLEPGGAVVLETAGGKAGEVAALLERLGYGDVLVTPDLTDVERIAEGRVTLARTQTPREGEPSK